MPTYTNWDNVPDNLKTKSALRELKLKPAKEQKPVAQKIGGYGPFDLYDLNDAIPVRKASDKQLVALAEARRVASLPVCERCRKKIEEGEGDSWMHTACWQLEEEEERQAEEAWERELAEMRITAKAEATTWARQRLNSNSIILDTQTTNLYGEIIEIAIINMQGDVLLNQRLNPINDITSGAQRIHGISREMLVDQPSYPAVHDELETIFASADHIIIYNAGFDKSCLRVTQRNHKLKPSNPDAECAMHKYAAWRGIWSDHHGDWSWRSLPNADRTALGDCRATLEVIQEMASSAE